LRLPFFPPTSSPTFKAACLQLLVSLLVATSSPAHADSIANTNFSALPRTESPNLKRVKPPTNPQVFNEHMRRDEIDKLPIPKQPAELTAVLLDLEKGRIDERIAKLKAKTIADLVYVRGGSFMRGDFAKLAGFGAVLTPNMDDKLVKEITLSDFWIGKYKVTYAEFDVFTDATGREKTALDFASRRRHPLLPAGTNWEDAKNYCLWLKQITGYPFDLPTEAQWEYAGRSRGQFFATATDDGNWDKGRNAPSSTQAEMIAKQYVKSGERYPVGIFPPNPLGLYDMAYMTWEWVKDWHSESAYSEAPVNDPSGPVTGKEKVIRSWEAQNGQIIGTNIWRKSEKPKPDGETIGGTYFRNPTSFSPTLRCVINSVSTTN